MNTQWLTPKAEVRRSDGKGDGAFAIMTIFCGETVAVFGGHPVTRAQLAALSAERRARSIQIDRDLYLVSGEAREPGDMINHSCSPNCGLRGDIVVVALRDIAAGEELAYDYAMSDGSPYDEFTCSCGSPHCRVHVSGEDWRRPELWQRCEGYFSPYLQRRIMAAQVLRALGVKRRRASRKSSPGASILPGG